VQAFVIIELTSALENAQSEFFITLPSYDEKEQLK
jgi:hypothetical protein